MSESHQCSRCGAGLPPDAPGGHCISCLLQLGLASGEAATDPLESPAPTLSTGKPGDRIGRYKLLQQIGEGGCGVVYMAEQEEPVRRRVALKVIKLGMDTKQVIARFEAERQALAMMDHPNIAKVLDAGATETGRPYFVMELVRGVKITDFCDQRRLTTRQRLDLFVQVCQAVQHAHQKGIIHRDLKPSNILVTEQDGKAAPKVIDFGIAKATTAAPLTDKTLFTAFEQFIGTPAYMSPEQAGLGGLDIDTRSDIYSLGVLLYELLTGKQPFDSAKLQRSAIDEILRIIREQEPPRPSARLTTLTEQELTVVAQRRQTEPAKFSNLLRGDLDWIVMKALEKERTRRYETANGVAMDLQRYLKNEPVVARPPSKFYRFQKLVRRHKLVFAAGITVAFVVVAGSVISTWQWRVATHNAQLARVEGNKSEQVARFLARMLEGVGPSKALGRDTAILREILDKSVTEVEQNLTNEPEVQAELYLVMGKTYEELGQYTNAVRLTRAAVRLRKAQSVSETPELADSLANLGAMLYSSNDYKGAEELGRQALEMRQRLYGNEHTNIATSLNNIGLALWNQNKMTEAEATEREALRMRKKLLGNDAIDVAKTLLNLANVQYLKGDFAGAEENFSEALRILQQRLPPEHPYLAVVQNNLATLLSKKGEFAAAAEMHAKTLDSRKKTLKEHPYVAYSMTQLAIALTALGEIDRAKELLQEALAMEGKLLPRESDDVATTLAAWGVVLAEKGDWSGAQTNQQKALAIRLKVLGNDNPDVTDSLDAVSLLSIFRGDLGAAEQTLQRARAIDDATPQGSHLNALPVLEHLGWVLEQKGDLHAAAACREKAATFRNLHGNYSESAWDEGVYALAHILCAGKKFSQAETLLLLAAEHLQKSPGVSLTLRRRCNEQLVRLYEAWDKAEPNSGKKAKTS